MRSEILSVGNEVLSGRTLDTNFQFLARLLDECGAPVVGHQAVADDPRAIAGALRLGLERADLVVLTGGLGPTPDDLTVRAVAQALGRPLVLDTQLLEQIRARWASFARRPMPANNEQQALLPPGAEAWPNPVGSAPGIHLRLADQGKDVVLLPGVPAEMEALAIDFLAPLVRTKSGTPAEYVTIRTTGIAESVLEEKLADLGARLPGAWVAYLPGYGGVDLRIGLPADATPARRRELTDTALAVVRERAGDYVYATEDRTLEEVLGGILRESGLTLALAESCTGGLIGARVTAVPGSSAYFTGGVVCYSDAVKIALVGVSEETLRAHGAVSEETVREMARGIAARLGTTCAIAVTGIAGPDGGTPEKPVGTVHVVAVAPGGEYHRALLIRGSRKQVRERSASAALELLRRLLVGLPAVTAGSMYSRP